MISLSRISRILSYGFLLMCSSVSNAALFGGVDFPGGASSFIDSVVLYEPLFGGGPSPTSIYKNTNNIIGAPDFSGVVSDSSLSLGHGGRITLQFTDNLLTGSGDSELDLWVFEVGPDVENTFIEISKNGLIWFSVGSSNGATNGVDIDSFGFGTSDFFSFVRLTDDPSQGGSTGVGVGADIDAIGAISSADVVLAVSSPPVVVLILWGVIFRVKRYFS